jgi:hypothetical protein
MHRTETRTRSSSARRLRSLRRSFSTAFFAFAFVAAASPVWSAPENVWMELLPSPAELAVPPLPPTSTYPVQLVLDDDTADSQVGAAQGQSSKQFLWFNRFSANQLFHLEEIWVLFPVDPVLQSGFPVQLVVFTDTDGDPSNGATLVHAENSTVQVADGNTFSIYPLAASLLIDPGSDVLIGVVPRYIVSGVTPLSGPAAIDTTSDLGRSWIAIWLADPPDPPSLPSDSITAPIATFVAGGGNWMIRGFGTGPSVTEVPTLGVTGMAVLAALLTGLSVILVRRRKA